MRSVLKLFTIFILRSLAREKLRSCVTVLGISLGVAAMLAIRLANTSALESFKAATDQLAGESSIQITGAAGRFDELLLRDMGWIAEYGQMSPVIAGYAMIEGNESGNVYPPSRRGQFVQILGVDILRDRPLRNYHLVKFAEDDRQPGAREFLSLLVDPKSIILTEKFARNNSLSIGSTIWLTIGTSRKEFTIRGLLRDIGPARALQGNFGLMDIAAAQLAFERLGSLDRIDVKLKPGLYADTVEADIESRLPEALKITRPQDSYEQVEKMIAAFHLNLTALGSIALLVGLFLIYNTVSISVISRRDEIGALRAAGATKRVVLAMFLGEALLLSGAGTLVGIMLGQALATLAVRATATTVDTFYIASIATQALERHSVGAAELLIAFAVATPLALFAAAIPSLEASRVDPMEAIRGAERSARSRRPSFKYLLISVALFGISYLMSKLDAINGLPVFGYVAALGLMFAGAFFVPGTLWGSCQLLSWIASRIEGRVQAAARLASANLRGAINRISISVAALAVSLAMMVAVSIMIGSFRDTVVYWVNQSMVADIYGRPMLRTATTDEGEIAPEAIESIEAVPEVEQVYPFATRQITYENSPITVGAGDFSIFLKYGRLLFKSPSDARAQLQSAIDRDVVSISEAFSIRFKKNAGDAVELPTIAGTRTFRIAAVYFDYSSSRGWVVMDRRTYERHFGNFKPTGVSIYRRPGADAAEIQPVLEAQISSRFPLFFITNQSLRREVMRIFDSTFAITYALEIIAIVVASLGVLSTLITLLLERRRELALLTFLGATRKQLRRMIITEAITIGGVSQSIGIAIGLLLSLVLIYVINVQSFGWTIQFHLPFGFLVRSTILILIATAIAGLYPAARATRLDPIKGAREE